MGQITPALPNLGYALVHVRQISACWSDLVAVVCLPLDGIRIFFALRCQFNRRHCVYAVEEERPKAEVKFATVGGRSTQELLMSSSRSYNMVAIAIAIAVAFALLTHGRPQASTWGYRGRAR